MIYELLKDRRASLIGRHHWLGTLRWFVEEMDTTGHWVFRTAPINSSECDSWRPNLLAGELLEGEPPQAIAHPSATAGEIKEPPAACRTFFGLQLQGFGSVESCCYQPDTTEVTARNGHLLLHLPMEAYGMLLEAEAASGCALRILTREETGRCSQLRRPIVREYSPGRVVWSDGAYSLVFRYAGELRERSAGGFDLAPADDGALRLAVAFHVDASLALAEAERLFVDSASVCEESRRSWESYFASCPVSRWELDYTWRTPDGVTVTHTADEILRRQYWHWHCLLSNVCELPFNDLQAYMAPDKAHWFGVWSNDGPECLRALAHTNRQSLVRTCLREYVRTAITAEGEHSWYLHGTGIGCLGNPGDSGRFSNGVPAIVSAVADYVEITGDPSLLDEPAGAGGTVWEKLTRYLRTVYTLRDHDLDGLVEWAHLWEGGPDDKVGPFFSQATLTEWIRALTTLGDSELRTFYRKNLRPVTNLYEQSFFLDALLSLEKLAHGCQDADTARYARERFDQTCSVLEERHWDVEDGFYYDWDVTGHTLIRIKNQDAFYLASHLKDPDRVARLFAHLDHPGEFGLLYTPTLARNEQGFNPGGYWCGGYWPREAAYLGRALHANGCHDKAVELLVKALCAAPGKVIPENMNPLTGEDNTGITGMAYNVLVALALATLYPHQPETGLPIPARERNRTGEIAQ